MGPSTAAWLGVCCVICRMGAESRPGGVGVGVVGKNVCHLSWRYD